MNVLDRLLSIWATEPALIVGVVNAVLVLVVTLGLPLDPDIKTKADAVILAVSAVLAAVWIRSQVTPA